VSYIFKALPLFIHIVKIFFFVINGGAEQARVFVGKICPI